MGELTNVDQKTKMDAVNRARKLQTEAQQRALARMNGVIRKERKTVGWESDRKLQVLAREREKKIKDQARERARRLLKERRAFRASPILSPGSRAAVTSTGFGRFAEGVNPSSAEKVFSLTRGGVVFRGPSSFPFAFGF